MKREDVKSVDEAFNKSREGKEAVLRLNSDVLYNTVGCNHEFIQKTATSVECRKCGLGLLGVTVEELAKKKVKSQL